MPRRRETSRHIGHIRFDASDYLCSLPDGEHDRIRGYAFGVMLRYFDQEPDLTLKLDTPDVVIGLADFCHCSTEAVMAAAKNGVVGHAEVLLLQANR